ncbi:MAG: (d)CMP kinase [Lachnospiraceae bacterium]|nr:(d)CMP kinase [Lachnospiraceae bacterium]
MVSNRPKNIAIDGPAGAGKSTVAKLVAKKLKMIYVDTGAMYRAMALFMLDEGISPDDREAVEENAIRADICIKYENGVQCIYLNGENVNDRIRSGEVSMAASKTSAFKAVRERMVALQKELAAKNDVVMDGRDIGTCVLPHAYLKVYMTAPVSVRAKRRYDENMAKGIKSDPEEIEKEIRDRDHRDMTREESPLRKAWDAVVLDTGNMTAEEASDRIVSWM